MAPVVLADQAFEAHQDLECLPQAGRALGGDARQPEVGRLAMQAHEQAEIGPPAELDGGMAQAHEARDADARAGLAQQRGGDAVALQQRGGVMAEAAQGRLQAVEESYREITEFHRHGAGAKEAECNPGL